MNTEKEKYYVPSIEEFHVGFEYEIESEFAHKFCICKDNSEYTKIKMVKTDIIGTISDYIDFRKIRVKYLDKEDIESLKVFTGWEYWIVSNNNDFKKPFEIHSREKGLLFNKGIIKNKSDLIKLMKQSDINL